MHDFSIRTDLACEAEATHDKGKGGTDYNEKNVDGFKVATLHVLNAEGEQTTAKRKGTYVTVFTELICNIGEDRISTLASLLAREIGTLATRTLGHLPASVLVAGLGNREITADAIGPMTVDRLTVTRHIEAHDKKLFDSLCRTPICAIAPGVLGQTGIETAELLRGICDRAHPELVIAIDALAARSTTRLGATVQISDSGISPGSGIGNHRSAVDKETLGVPVLAVGVPTVVNSATLVYDALQSAGCEINRRIEQVLHSGESFYVSPRQSDRISDSVSTLLATALDTLFLY